ncbi:MAG: PAS domain-containing protein [Oxalobacteraceae bacterium]
MRQNLPITSVEYVLVKGTSLVSKTDTKGRITYVNPAFIEVSGFTENELIGAPHNIVRHPDMPPEAFSDLWETLKSGIPWTGLVQNRSKNGDYYWVLANVTPLIVGGV